MRKRITGQERTATSGDTETFLDLERLARVEVTSEDPGHPIESALLPGHGDGWRAAVPGPQRIRLLFDEPQRVRRIRLAFEELHAERTQEFALSWVPAGEGSVRSLVRQQYTFSPGGSTHEVENYAFDLDEAAALELEIVPDIRGGGACASLVSFRIA
jgi:hypothetical protein